MSRAEWTIMDYIDELITLHELEEGMDRDQWNQIYTNFKNEMIDRFPADVRKDYGLIF